MSTIAFLALNVRLHFNRHGAWLEPVRQKVYVRIVDGWAFIDEDPS